MEQHDTTGPAAADAPATASEAGRARSPLDPVPAAAQAEPGAAGEGEAQRQLQDALLRASENHDLYLRARAEAENTRRRAQDDVAKAHKYAVETFAEALLPVMDSLEKALENAAGAPPALREGVEITLRQLSAAFERGRLLPISPVGEKFDPHRHQAISVVAAPEGVPPNHVVAVLQKGWLLVDRVLRPALVTVAQSGPTPST